MGLKEKIAKIWKCNPDSIPNSIRDKDDYLEYINENKILAKKITGNIDSIDYNVGLLKNIRTKRYYTVTELSLFLNVRTETLATWKVRRQNLPYYILGDRLRYFGLDILNFVKYIQEVNKIKDIFLENMIET